jgi:N-methylhydantoinase B
LFGGHHGNSCFFYSVEATDIRERFGRGEMPADHDAIAATGDGRVLLAKEKDLPLGPHDVAEMAVYGAGGYGDPVRRAPHLVAHDIAEHVYDEALAAAVYGVVFADGVVDVDATEQRRAAIRADRLRQARHLGRVGPVLASSSPSASVGDGIIAGLHAGEAVLACAECRAALSAVDENYKASAAWLDTQLHEIDPATFTDPSLDTDEPVVYRLYLCPRCGIVLDSELTVADQPPLFDTCLRPDSVTAFLRRSTATTANAAHA